MEVSPSCVVAATLWAHLLRTQQREATPDRAAGRLPLAVELALERLGLPLLAAATAREGPCDVSVDSQPAAAQAANSTQPAATVSACCCPGSRCYAAACVRPGAGEVVINRVPAAALPCCGRYLGRAYRGCRFALRLLDTDIAKGGAGLVVPNVAFLFESSPVAGPSPFDLFVSVEVWNAGPLGPNVVAECLAPALAACGRRAIRSPTTHLTMGECAMDAATLRALARALAAAKPALNLRHLGIEFLTPSPTSPSTHAEMVDALSELLQALPSLESLSLKGAQAVFFPPGSATGTPLEAPSECISRTAHTLRQARESGICPLLTRINVSYCEWDASAIKNFVSAIAPLAADPAFATAAHAVSTPALPWSLNLSSNIAACGDSAGCAEVIECALKHGALVAFALGGGAIPTPLMAAAQRALANAATATTVEVVDLSHATVGGCSVRDVSSFLRSLRRNSRCVSRLRLLNCGHILDQHGTATDEVLLFGIRKSETFLSESVAARSRRQRRNISPDSVREWILRLRNAGVGDLIDVVPGGPTAAAPALGSSAAVARRKGGPLIALSASPVGDAVERCPSLGLALFMLVELDLTHTQLADRHVRVLCDALVGAHGCRSLRLEAHWSGPERRRGSDASSSDGSSDEGGGETRSTSTRGSASDQDGSESDSGIDIMTAASVAARPRQLRVLRIGGNRLTELSVVYLARALAPAAKRPSMVPHLHTIDLSLTESLISKKHRAAGVTHQPALAKALVDLFMCPSVQHLSVAHSDIGPFVVEGVVLGAQSKLVAPLVCLTPAASVSSPEGTEDPPPAAVPLMLNLLGNCAGRSEVDLMMRLPLWARDPSSGLAAGRLRIFS